MLTKDQLAAIHELHDFITNPKRKKEQFFILTGSAGTGKTFLLSHLYHVLKATHHIAFTASTNKAVNVLQATYDSTVLTLQEEEEGGGGGKEQKIEAQKQGGAGTGTGTTSFNTIHRFMKSQRSIDVNGNTFFKFAPQSTGKKKMDVVFVDEISMISGVLATQIANMKNYPKIVLVGDKAQLPPVDEAESPIFGWKVPQCNLTQIVRYTNNIVKLADQIKQLIFFQARTKLQACQGNGVTLYRDNISFWLSAYFAGASTAGANTVVLAYTNDRVRFYNDLVRKHTIAAISAPTGTKFEAGEKIMFNNFYRATALLRDAGSPPDISYYTSYQVHVVSCVQEVHVVDYSAILATLHQDLLVSGNSEFCCLKSFQSLLPNNIPIYKIVTEGSFVVLNPLNYQKVHDELDVIKTTFGHLKSNFTDDTVETFWDFFYTKLHDAFADITYGYAMTVHKSQGSTYKRVFIDMKDIIQRNPKERESYQCLYTAITRASQEVHIFY